MSFEELECLKNAFTIYNISSIPPPPYSESKTLFVLKKRDTTYMRVIVPPPVYGVKHHFKMLIRSLLSKLRINRNMNK
jgi:hypothetical protein